VGAPALQGLHSFTVSQEIGGGGGGTGYGPGPSLTDWTGGTAFLHDAPLAANLRQSGA
jgi:hypothetical protein